MLLFLCCFLIALTISSYKLNQYQRKFSSIKMSDLSPSNSAVIVGSGPAGLTTAIMLARKGYTNIKLFDRLDEPPHPGDSKFWEDLNNDRSYCIGVTSRGQKALRQFDILPRLEKYSAKVCGRRDWEPSTGNGEPKERITLKNSDKFTRCLQRDRLASCLLEEIREKYSASIDVTFNTECKGIEYLDEGKKTERVRLTLSREDSDTPATTWITESNFVIGADGAQSVIRIDMEKKKENNFFHRKFEDKNVRVYKTIPLHLPPNDKNWRLDLNYSVRTKFDINIDALPTVEGKYIGVILFRPWDQRILKLTTLAEGRAFFDEMFPMISKLIIDSDILLFIQRKPSKLPKFSYAGPVLHRGKTTCLIGDAIHTVKPYFGAGVNSAFEDITYLEKAIDTAKGDTSQAIKLYSKERAKEAKALVEISTKLDGGFLTFILPLIIDAITNKLCPWIFSPNTISCLQIEELKFSQIQRRKRLDRFLQVILAGLLSIGTVNLIKILCKLVLNFALKKKFVFF